MLKLIKENVGYKDCAFKVMSRIKAIESIEIFDEKESINQYQYKLKDKSGDIGCLRFYQKKDGSTTIDDSQIKEGYRDQIREVMNGYITLKAFKTGTVPLGTRHFSDPILIKKVKTELLSKFKQLKDSGLNNQIFEYRLEGNNLIMIQYKVGSLLFQGKATEFSDEVIKFVDKLITDEQRSFLLNRIKEQVPKEDFETICEALDKRQLRLNEFISSELYSVLSGCGSHLLQDGLVIFQVMKENKIELKDYGSVLRNFAMLFEDFLIEWMIKLKLIKECDLQADTKATFVGRVLGDPNKIKEMYGQYYIRTRPKFIEKLQAAYQECRHDLLHADKFKYQPIESFEKAERRLKTIIDCMEDCTDLFSDFFAESDNKKNLDIGYNVVGTDESGKGDYFGPLVVAGVYIDTPELEEKLRNMGVQDSKNLSDVKVIELSNEICKVCKHNVVLIGPTRYNELYDKMNNLNDILGWGHARVIENILGNGVDPSCIISDKFGNESIINSSLMEKGKKVNLIQEIRAEQNISVAAASILARAGFLKSIQKVSLESGFKIPKGAGDVVVDVARDLIKSKGKESLRNFCKTHFKITKKL